MAFKVKKGDKLKIQTLNQYFNGTKKYYVYNQSLVERELKKGKGAGNDAQSKIFETREQAKKFIKEKN